MKILPASNGTSLNRQSIKLYKKRRRKSSDLSDDGWCFYLDLPEPVLPTIPTFSPALTVKLTPSNAGFNPGLRSYNQHTTHDYDSSGAIDSWCNNRNYGVFDGGDGGFYL